jgi:membrane associated rhomboid family serine protease
LKISTRDLDSIAMLEDREYMRQPAYERRISFTVAILVVNAIVYFGLKAFGAPGVNLEDNYLALSLGGLKSGYVWELLTFQFLHANLMHLLFNCLTIFFVGRIVENALGGTKFLTLYFTSGVIGGLVQMLYALVLREDASVVGASAGAAGLIGAFALMAWDQQFTMIIYFIPVTMRGKTLFFGSVIVCLVWMMFLNSGIANAAHLGGLLAGFFYVRQIVQGRWHWPQWKLPARPAPPSELAAKYAGKKSAWRSGSIPPAEDLTADEFLQKEVDPILDKISENGIQSLTAREREILEKARSKMNKR